jgi:predicted nucleic acid-binding protein
VTRRRSPRSYLLDTSALLALIEDEPGAARVEFLVRNETILIPWVALLEVHYVTSRRQDAAEADRRYGLLTQLGATVLWENDERLLLQASRLKADHQMSLADCLIAAHCARHLSVLVHRDSEYRQLAGEVELEEL